MEFQFLTLRRSMASHASTISMSLKNKMIKAASDVKGSKVISKQRPQIIEEIDKLLLVFIDEKQLKGDSLSEVFICEKVLYIYVC